MLKTLKKVGTALGLTATLGMAASTCAAINNMIRHNPNKEESEKVVNYHKKYPEHPYCAIGMPLSDNKIEITQLPSTILTAYGSPDQFRLSFTTMIDYDKDGKRDDLLIGISRIMNKWSFSVCPLPGVEYRVEVLLVDFGENGYGNVDGAEYIKDGKSFRVKKENYGEAFKLYQKVISATIERIDEEGERACLFEKQPKLNESLDALIEKIEK